MKNNSLAGATLDGANANISESMFQNSQSATSFSAAQVQQWQLLMNSKEETNAFLLCLAENTWEMGMANEIGHIRSVKLKQRVQATGRHSDRQAELNEQVFWLIH